MLDLERFRANPLLRGFAFLVEAGNHAEAGRTAEALDALERALTEGCRYKASWLEQDRRLAPLREEPRFIDLVGRSDTRYTADAAAARPRLTFAIPDDLPDAFGYPLLVVLHGNNSNASFTAPQWSSLADAGWVVAVPQSSEIGSTPDAYTWNDRERTAAELDVHIEKVKRATSIDVGRIVLAGFSMGATQALALALTRRIKCRGVVPIAAWLPRVDEFRALVEGGAGKVLRVYGVIGDQERDIAITRELFDIFAAHKVRSELDVRPGLGHEYPADMSETIARATKFITAP
jgi:pimeloyl-ACP methyl ester carboxylesterase